MARPESCWWAAASLCAIALPAVPIEAQETENDRPRVERISFRGAESLDGRELRASIVTEETRCRSVLLRPFCWLTDWGIFVDKAYLPTGALPRDELRLEVQYFRRGYREAAVTSDTRPRGRGIEVVFTIEEGPPTVIVSREIVQAERVVSDRQIRWARVPDEGEPLDLIRLDSARAELQLQVEDAGYLDGVVADSAAVDPETRRARLTVRIDPGPRSTVGGFDIRGNDRISDDVIRTATVLREGRVVRRRDLVAAERSLYESNLFHEASVEVPAQPDSAKRLRIDVREAPQRLGELGGGVNTLEFVQLEARFTDYNWLGGGRRLDARGSVGNLLAGTLNGRGFFGDMLPGGPQFVEDRAFLRPTWQASLDFQQPGFRASENTIGAGLFAHRRIIPGVAIDYGHGADVSFTRLLRDRSPTSARYQVEVTRVQAGELYFCAYYGLCDPPTIEAVRQPLRLSPLSLSFIRDRSDDPLDPRRGSRTRLDLEHASGLTWSEFHYHRVSGAWAYYHPTHLGRRVLATRVRGGWVRSLGGTSDALDLPGFEGEVLHPRKRFYAGGATSVRGYGENQLGPRILTVSPAALTDPALEDPCTPAEIADGSCDPAVAPMDAFLPRPLGGTSVLQGNVEYRFPVWRQVTGAVFVDGAIVGGREPARVGRSAWAVTPGFGGRYETAIGPVRVDLGIRPRRAETLEVVTEVIEDGQRRIVRLDMPLEYDPLAEATGFFGRILGRLRLHISIGQAF